MTPTGYGYGYIPDPVDDRDAVLDDLPLAGATLDATTDLSRYVLRILSQGVAPACVGFSTAQAIRVRWCAQIDEQRLAANISDQEIPLPSALLIWWLARQASGNEMKVSGTFIRDAFKKVARYGVCDDRYWPSAHALEAATTTPPANIFRLAWDLRAKSGRGAPVAYYRIPGSGKELVAGIKRALSNRLPVVFGAPVDSAFCRARAHTGVLPPPVDSQIVGNHAMTLIGYRSDRVLGVNSWGDGWGNRGLYWGSWDWISRYAADVWAVDAPPPITKKG